MTYLTIDSKLTFDKQFLYIKKVKQNSGRSYWFDSFLLLAIYIGLQAYKAINEKPLMRWAMVLIGLTWIYPHLERIFKILFIYTWRNKIKLDKIVHFKILQDNYDLETTLELKLNNGRQKLLIFRTAENQIDAFVENLKREAIKLA